MRYERMRKRDLVALIGQLKDEKLNDPPGAAYLLKGIKIDYSQEHFILVVLDNKMHVLLRKVLFKGGLTESIVDLRVLFHTALSVKKGTSILIGHNHPTNTTTPSSEDLTVTKRINDACQILGLHLIDHIIFTETDSYLSLKEGGYL